MALGATTPIPVTTTRRLMLPTLLDSPSDSASTPIPATVAEATSVPSALCISTSARSFIRRKKTFRALMVTVSPGRTTPENSAVTSVNTVSTRRTSSTPLRSSDQVDAQRHHPGLGHRLDERARPG